MEFRQLGRSGLKVPVLSFGTGTFGGKDQFKSWGSTNIEEAQRLVDICLESGLNFFDSADIYSQGLAEEILGSVLEGKRHQVLISTKATFRMGPGSNEIGSSRFHLIKACEAQLKRLKTDYIDLYQMHGFDPITPVEEVLRALENLIQSGKVRYIGSSNFSGWHLMKSLSTSDRLGIERYVSHQVYYSLVGRDYEQELMPLGLDQGVSAMVWSPLGWGRLTGKISRKASPKTGRLQEAPEAGPQVESEYLFNVIDVLTEIAEETGKQIPQIALNWLLQKPTVANVIIGARNEEQLRANLGAVGWQLTQTQMARLDKVSQRPLPYPYWHQQEIQKDRRS